MDTGKTSNGQSIRHTVYKGINILNKKPLKYVHSKDTYVKFLNRVVSTLISIAILSTQH